MKRSLFIITYIVFTFMILSCTSIPTREVGKEYKLTILHTNDHKIPDNLTEREEFVKKFYNTNENVLILDVGKTNSNLKIKEPYVIDYDGFRIAVCKVDVTQTTVNNLRKKEKVDIIIAVNYVKDIFTSLDTNDSINTAKTINGIDLIIDGSFFNLFKEPKFINGTNIVSVNQKENNLGKIDFSIVDGKITSINWKSIEIPSGKYNKTTHENLQTIIMTTSEKFDAGNKLSCKKETALGNFISDSQVNFLAKEGINVDFALTNGGNIRTSLPKGNVSKTDILTMLPYKTYVYVLELKGIDVIQLFEYIGSQVQGSSGWAQVSEHVSYTISYNNSKGSISNVLINGAQIDTSKTYKIAVNNYLASGGEGYHIFKNATSILKSSVLLSDMVIWYASTLKSPVSPKIDNRISVVGGIKL